MISPFVTMISNVSIENQATTCLQQKFEHEEQAEEVLTDRTRWKIWMISGICILIVYSCFFFASFRGEWRTDLRPTPELLAPVFLKVTRSNGTELIRNTVATLARVSSNIVQNATWSEKQMATAMMPVIGAAIPTLLGMDHERLASVILQMATQKKDKIGDLKVELENFFLAEQVMKEVDLGGLIGGLGMDYFAGATFKEISPPVIRAHVFHIFGMAYTDAVGRLVILDALPKFWDLTVGAILIRERPKFTQLVYLALGPVSITYVILIVYLIPVIKFRHHILVRKRGKFYLWQVFTGAFLVVTAQFIESFFLAHQSSDNVLNDRTVRSWCGFLAVEFSVFASNLYGFALVQRLDMIYQAFILNTQANGKRLSPYSFFRIGWVCLVCMAISTIAVGVWFFLSPIGDKLRPHMNYLTFGVFGNFFIYVGLVGYYIWALWRADGSKRFLDLTETIRHLVFQISGFTVVVLMISADVRPHRPTLIIISYFTSFSVSWFAIDVFSLPMWLMIRDRVKPYGIGL